MIAEANQTPRLIAHIPEVPHVKSRTTNVAQFFERNKSFVHSLNSNLVQTQLFEREYISELSSEV